MRTSSFRTTAVTARVSVVTLLGLSPLYAANYDFDNGGGTGDWNLNTNWSADVLPSTADNVFINVTGAAIKTITLAATPVNATVNEVGLARTGDGSATVNHTGGTLTVQNWFNLGQGIAAAGNNGTGIWNMSGSSVLNATHSAGGQTVIGVGFAISPDYNTGILTLTDNAQFLQTANDIRIGGELATSRATGAVILNGNSLLSKTGAGLLYIGHGANGSTGTMILNDNAQVAITGNDTRVGNLGGSSGTLTLNGSSQFNLTANNLMVGDSASASGTVNINGNSVVNVKALMTWSGAGTVNINAGSLVTAGTLATGWITLGQNAGATAVWNHNAGNVTTPTVWTTYNAAGTYNLNGGTLSTALLSKGSGTGIFNFNGGTLRATGALTLGGGNVTTAQVRDGGAVIDSNGLDVIISQGILHSDIGGDNATDGGLTKTGTGSLTLSGSNSYTGTTTVSQGTLLLNGSTASAGLINVSALATLAGSGSGGDVTVADNGILAPGAAASNHFSMQDLTLGNTSTLAFELDGPDPDINALNDHLNITGNLLLNGVLRVSKRTTPGFGTPSMGDRWLLMSVGGTITDQILTVDPSAPALDPGLAYAIETDTSIPGFGKVYLSVVPEPGTSGLLILGALLLRRRARI